MTRLRRVDRRYACRRLPGTFHTHAIAPLVPFTIGWGPQDTTGTARLGGLRAEHPLAPRLDPQTLLEVRLPSGSDFAAHPTCGGDTRTHDTRSLDADSLL